MAEQKSNQIKIDTYVCHLVWFSFILQIIKQTQETTSERHVGLKTHSCIVQKYSNLKKKSMNKAYKVCLEIDYYLSNIL